MKRACFASRLCRGSIALATFVTGPLLAQSQPADPSLGPNEIAIRGIRPRRDASEVRVTAEQARAQAGTHDDPGKVIENLPGVARSSFGSDLLVLWGAAPEDSRVYVDGVEIPQLFHGGGIRTVVNGNLVQSVTLTPGAYGADYGRAIGGMVRLETRDLDAGYHATLDASPLDASALVSAGLGDRVRVAVAARYGLLDRTLDALGALDARDFVVIPRYHDYQAKVQLALAERESLDAVWLGSADDSERVVGSADPAREQRLHQSASFGRLYLRYRRGLADGASVEVVPWVGRDASVYDAHFGGSPALLDERTLRFGVRAEHRSRVARSTVLRLGLDVAGSRSDIDRAGSLTIPAREGDQTVFGQPPGDDSTTDQWQSTLVDVAPYATLDCDWGPLTVTPGLRLDGYLLETSRLTPRIGQTPSLGRSSLEAEIQPRLSARLRLSSRVSLVGALGAYSQPPVARDLSAVFGTPSLGPESAWHASLGESVELTPQLNVQLTAFVRTLSSLAVRDPSPTPQLAHALLTTGTGRSYGAQLALTHRPWHGFSGSLAYTLSRSERRDTPGASLRWFDYDEPAVLTAQAVQGLGAWSLGARFRYASGAPRTSVSGAFFDAKGAAFQPVLGPRDSLRLPAFWQLDVRVDRRFRLSERAQLTTYLELLNATDHENAEEYQYSGDYARRGNVTGLPLVATLGARLEL